MAFVIKRRLFCVTAHRRVPERNYGRTPGSDVGGEDSDYREKRLICSRGTIVQYLLCTNPSLLQRPDSGGNRIMRWMVSSIYFSIARIRLGGHRSGTLHRYH